jgi:hypothetical protein
VGNAFTFVPRHLLLRQKANEGIFWIYCYTEQKPSTSIVLHFNNIQATLKMAYNFLVLGFGALWYAGSVWGNNNDLYNYGYTTFDDANGKSYGQPDWASITCDDPSICVC